MLWTAEYIYTSQRSHRKKRLQCVCGMGHTLPSSLTECARGRRREGSMVDGHPNLCQQTDRDGGREIRKRMLGNVVIGVDKRNKKI